MRSKYPTPDFICIGPHKTGTSWLYRTLSTHKQVKKSIVKELDYFLVQDIKSQGLLSSLGFRKSYLNRTIQHRLLSKNLKGTLSKSGNAKKKLEYHLRILLGLFSYEFYSSFFEKDDDQIVGDISPSYFALSLPTMQMIKKKYPSIKIIIFLREPVSRMKSHLKMMHANSDISTGENRILENIEFLKEHNEKGLYPFYGLKNWLSVFDLENVFVGFYDDFKIDPVSFFKRICRFLEISDHLESAIHYQKSQNVRIKNQRVNQTFNSAEDVINFSYNSSKMEKMEFPSYITESLCKHYYKDVELLADYVDSPFPKDWLRYYDTRLSNAKNEA